MTPAARPAGLSLPLPSFQIHPLSLLEQFLTGALSGFVGSARSSIDSALRSYLFQTDDQSLPLVHRPFTDTPGVSSLNHLLAASSAALVTAVLLYSALRTVASPAGSGHHHLQAVLPRAMVAVTGGALSLPLIQQAIDLNNALCQLVTQGGSLDPAALPWSSPISQSSISSASSNLFLLLFAAALVVALVILILAYVVRYTLLAVLCACAPLAAIAWILPETRGFARQWLRLLVVSLFMQFVQLLVLRAAVSLAFARGHGVTGVLYGFAALYLMLRVPGALNVAAHYQASAEGAGRRWTRAARRLAGGEL